jgi:hypothetical protein
MAWEQSFLVLLLLFGVSLCSEGCYVERVNETDVSFLVCKFCASKKFRYFANQQNEKLASTICAPSKLTSSDEEEEVSLVANVLHEYGQLQGYFWNNETLAVLCIKHLIKYMPRRDAILLFDESGMFFDFLFEHLRYSLLSRTSGRLKFTAGIPLDIFLDYVLPYSFINEKRDLFWRWRPKFYQALHASVMDMETVTDAMHLVASTVPQTFMMGFLKVNQTFEIGDAITWESETSPMNLSPEQVSEHHGSCTGTAITMAAMARSVGIPIRIVGCSQSIEGDDHHWTEFYDPLSIGPFRQVEDEKYWHTKEGTSKGNSGGPWDSLSTPMRMCLEKLIPKDPNKLNTIWVTKYSGAENLPLQWGNSETLMKFGRIGSLNRCGAYCLTWGCGAEQKQYYTQDQCGVSNP